jgi:hypothetical protein
LWEKVTWKTKKHGEKIQAILITEFMWTWSEWKPLTSNRCILSCNTTRDWDAGRESGEKRTAYFNTTHCSCLKIKCKKQNKKISLDNL